MKPLLRAEDIHTRINELEHETLVMEGELKDKFMHTYESFKPSNLLKNALSDVGTTPGLKSTLLSTVLNVGLGYLGNKLLWSRTAGIATKAAGAAIQLGAGKVIGQKLKIWKNFATSLFTKDKKQVSLN